MEPIPLIRATQLNPFTQVLRQRGADVGALLGEAELPVQDLDETTPFIPERPLWALSAMAAERLGIEDFGFLAWRTRGMEHLGLRLDRLSTRRDGLHAFCRHYTQISSTTRFGLKQDTSHTWFYREGMPGFDAGRWQTEQYTLAMMIDIACRIGEECLPPTCIHLQTDRASGLENLRHLEGTRIHIGQALTALALPNTGLDAPLPKATDTCPTLKSLAPTAPPRDFAGSLRQALTPYMREGHVTIQRAARITGLSTRTLQRRIAASGFTYSQLLDQARLELALPLLRNATVKLLDIAYDLGYSDPAHFTRAFRRWSGLTPSAYRERQAAA